MSWFRWWIALTWDWLFPRSCWAETAAWSLKTEGCRLRREAAGKYGDGYCPDAVKTEVGCWCGKFRGRP